MQDPEYAKQYLDKDLDEYMAEAPEAATNGSSKLSFTVSTFSMDYRLAVARTVVIDIFSFLFFRFWGACWSQGINANNNILFLFYSTTQTQTLLQLPQQLFLFYRET